MTGNAVLSEVDTELMQEFLNGSEEHITGAETALIALEKNPRSMELINETFRHFHSLKGDAASMGISEIRDLAHEMESLLDELRVGSRSVTPELLDLLLDGLAALSRQMRQVENGESVTAETGLVSKFADLLKAPQQVEATLATATAEKTSYELTTTESGQVADTRSERTYIVFSSGGLRCAINVDYSNEIISQTHITSVPNVANFIQGVINLRGSIIPVINLAKRLNIPTKNTENPQILILILNGTKLGLLVEEVYEVCAWSEDRLLRPTSVAFDLQLTFVSDVVVENSQINLILNLAEIVRIRV